jgi:hypothetical protein
MLEEDIAKRQTRATAVSFVISFDTSCSMNSLIEDAEKVFNYLWNGVTANSVK